MRTIRNTKIRRGAPTKYKPEFNKIAYQLCLLGATDKQLAEALGVNVDSINEWKKVYPEFSESLIDGKLKADGKVAAALFKRATGFKFDETTFVKGIEIKKVTKLIPPDTGAALSWLKNRQKDLWREKEMFEFENLTEEQLDKIVEKLKRSAGD